MGIATAAVYYIKEQDVWKSSNESVKTLERFKVICKPYVLEAKKQIPMEVCLYTMICGKTIIIYCFSSLKYQKPVECQQ